MYANYYRLNGNPFALTPDDMFFYESHPHRKAMAYLNYGLSKKEGFVVITGEIGAGKTTVLAHLRASLVDDSRLVTAWLTTSRVEAHDLLRLVASAFGLPADGAASDKATLLRGIEAFLHTCHKDGRRACLVVDEAQGLSAGSLEELRMLSNFECEGRALLQIFLVGQPEFRMLLQRDDLEQLRQRIIASFHLSALDAEDTRKYIEHRLGVAGWQGLPGISPAAFGLIFAQSRGVPRKINLLCDRLLLHGYLAEKLELGEEDAAEVIRDLAEELPLRATAPSSAPPVAAPTPPQGDNPAEPRPCDAIGMASADVEDPAQHSGRTPAPAPASKAGHGKNLSAIAAALFNSGASAGDATMRQPPEARPRGRRHRVLVLVGLLIAAVLGLALIAYSQLSPPSRRAPPGLANDNVFSPATSTPAPSSIKLSKL
jgi:general secretion pathway protein A